MKEFIDDPYLREVVRIIKEECFWRYGDKCIILVSPRFYNTACKYIKERDEDIFGEGEKKALLIDSVLAFPVWWLRDYEYEVRTQQ